MNVHLAVLPQTQPTPGPSTTEPTSPSSSIWTDALKIAEQKLSNNKPPIILSLPNSDSAKANIGSIIETLKNVQGDDKKKRWIGERFGTILKCVEKYSKIVDTAIQVNPQVAALVWAGIWGILQVSTCNISNAQCVKLYLLHG